MSEFPALRQALVAAAARRRRRRLLTGAAVPVFAVGAAVVALISLPGSAPEREAVAPAPKGALEQAFSVFRRAQKPSDVMPSLRVVPGTVDRGRTRLLGQGGPTRYFAAPSTISGVPSICVVAVRRKVASAAGCEAVSDAVKESKPPGITVGTATGVFLPDSSTDLRFIFSSGVGSVTASNNLSLSMNPQGPALGTSWTGASGTRYIRYTGLVPKAGVMPVGCPKKLDPLPDDALVGKPNDALARARQAALIAVDRYFPAAKEATVTAAARATATPCSDAITERSIEVSLRLVPKAQGRVLLGMENGIMRVFYLLH